MAQFPPPPFMEAPVYILPHSYVQPLDHLRVNNTAGALNRRAPAPAAFPMRGTVSTEVQTERPPRADRRYDVCSDSGNGTTSCSPLSSSSSASHKPGPKERSSPEKRPHVGDNVIPSFLPSTLETQNQDGVNQQPRFASNFHSSHFNVWSQSSDKVPLCSSSQSKNVADGCTHGSFPNIGMFDNTEVTCGPLRLRDELPDKSGSLRETEANDGLSQSNYEVPESLGRPGIPESRMEEDFRKLGQTVQCSTYRDGALCSLNTSQDRYEQRNLRSLHEDTSETIIHCLSSSSIHMRGKINESLWSVESLEPFIPSREWLLQNGLSDTEVIAETEEDQDRLSTLKDTFVSLKVSGRTDSDAVPVLDNRLVFSTPERPGSQLNAEKVRDLSSPPQHVNLSTERDLGDKRTSLSGAQCPKPQVVVASQQLEHRPTPPVQVRVCPCLQQDAVAEGSVSGGAVEEGSVRGGPSPLCSESEVSIRGDPSGTFEEGSVRGGPSSTVEEGPEVTQDLLVIAAPAELQILSPSRRPLMDCGIQCTDLCDCGGLKDCMGTNQLPPLIGPGVKKVNRQLAEINPTDRRSSKPWKQSNHWRTRNPGGTGRATRH